MLKPFFVRQNKLLMKVDPAEVLCLSTERNYTKLYLADKTHLMVRSTLSSALKKLPPEIFIKTHRSHAVSVYHIYNIAKDHLVINDFAVPIGKLYYRKVIEQLNIIE